MTVSRIGFNSRRDQLRFISAIDVADGAVAGKSFCSRKKAMHGKSNSQPQCGFPGRRGLESEQFLQDFLAQACTDFHNVFLN